MITGVYITIERDDGLDFDINMDDMSLEEEGIVDFFTAMGHAVKNAPKYPEEPHDPIS